MKKVLTNIFTRPRSQVEIPQVGLRKQCINSSIYFSLKHKELDLSNAASGGLNLYPETDNQVHEVLIGMKLGNYIVQIDVPNGRPLWKLPQASMNPSKTDADLKYLGAKSPEDSPAYSPNLKFWFIKDMSAVILRPIVLSGVDFERVTFTFKVAKHVLTPLPGKPPGAYDTIPYIEELRWS